MNIFKIINNLEMKLIIYVNIRDVFNTSLRFIEEVICSLNYMDQINQLHFELS